MHAIRQKCRPKHQVLILKCYPQTTKGAVDVKPNSSELSYLLYYATTRRSKVQKVGAFLEKKTASDVWRQRIGNVQVTLQILAALIEKAPRDLPLYAPYVLKILILVLRSRDITMVESSIPTFEAFCEHHDGASLSADQEYLRQYVEIVRIYASFASTTSSAEKVSMSAPVAMRWRNVGLKAIKSVASSEALASLPGRQLNVTVPMLLENIWTGNEDFIGILEHRAHLEEKVDTETLLRRRTSNATVQTTDTSGDAHAALSATTADADKLAEERTGILAIQCLKQIFEVNNRSQIHEATIATLAFIAERVTHKEEVIDEKPKGDRCGGWATKIFNMIAQWTPVQDRYVILVTAMEVLVRGQLVDENLQQQLVLATMVDSLLNSDINLIGLSVMDVLLGLINHVLRVLQLGGAEPHPQQENGSGASADLSLADASASPQTASVPTSVRRNLLERLQQCIGDLATHVYYADQISDMVAAILLRLKPTPTSSLPNTAAAIENPNLASATVISVGDLTEDSNTDGFFSFGTAKINGLEAIKAILLVASHRKTVVGGASLGRHRVPVKVWEGTQWLLRDSDGRVRKAYADALLTWLDTEVTRADLRAFEEKPKNSTKPGRNDSATNLTKRAVSNSSHREKPVKVSKTTFLQLLNLAMYENALQYVDSETDIVLLHLLLTKLVEKLGVNAVKNGLPMIFRLQEDILEAETPIAKIRIGSLCHGYFWLLSVVFNFESSPIGRAIQNEIHRRQTKMFWVDRIRVPPMPLHQIGTPGTTTQHQALPLEELESEGLTPFDDRFQLVKLISLSYKEAPISPPTSPPISPGRSFSQGLINLSHVPGTDRSMPEVITDQMMSDWTKDGVIALIQEGSKSVSLNGSRSGTNATGRRNFLAVNGMNTGGSNSGSQSPQGHHNVHRNTPNSTYGLVGGLGALSKLRKGNGNGYSPSPTSDSSRNSVTRVDQLKRVLTGQADGPRTKTGRAHSDASSESMVSYDFTGSEVSFTPGQQNVSQIERSVSLREPNERARSKSHDRSTLKDENQRPFTSNTAPSLTGESVAPEEEDPDAVPPVPPLPSSLVGENTAVHDHALPDSTHKSRSVKRNTPWGDDALVVDLESLLNGIDTSGEQKGNLVTKPPY
ncbi:Protein EFR3 [Lachnellula willkommii]|uniref:Protein EFR3 n=1 Tax=Lachnellula willkommii TaxID=215461 RepID=A0A559MC62_9HELO|nr:Protein EFR3 [Lachnellula willkommii]